MRRKLSGTGGDRQKSGRLASENNMVKRYHESGSFVLDRKTMEITKRLTSPSPKRQSLLRDRHGCRSNLIMG